MCVACKVFFKIKNFEVFGKFFKFVTLTVSCFDLGSSMNWSIVWIIMRRRGVSSERRRSSSSYIRFHCDVIAWRRVLHYRPCLMKIQVRLNSPTTQLFAQQLNHSITKKTSTLCIVAPLYGECVGASLWRGKRLHVMTSSSLGRTLRWRHNELDGVSDHQPHDCLLNRLFRRRSKKTSKLRVTGLCAGNSPGTGEFSAQMASNAENVSIWWRHHE